jgi:aerobic carbon-monoxide dehydrogenase small subunit
VETALRVNGSEVVRDLAPEELLLDFLRDSLGLTGAKRSCDVQVCGACTVLVDGLPVSSCCFLAADATGKEVTTIEGLAGRPEFGRLEEAFTRHAALQCGFCTPGMLLTVSALLESGELESEDEIKRSLAGNLCRCTGYRGILEAVAELAEGQDRACPSRGEFA